jgi:hypothetical protein
MFKPPGLLATQVAPTAMGLLLPWAAVASPSEHLTVCYLPAPRICQIPSDLVVRYQAIDIVGAILSFIW